MILETIGSLVVGAIGACIGWGATEFVARPIRKFFDLRGDAIRMIAQYANLPKRYQEYRGAGENMIVEDPGLSENSKVRLREAQDALRALAAQMRGFAYNEASAVRALQFLGYDPIKASEGLFGIANTVDTTGDARIMPKKMVTDALKLREHTL
jgi:hypothetical protein